METVFSVGFQPRKGGDMACPESDLNHYVASAAAMPKAERACIPKDEQFRLGHGLFGLIWCFAGDQVVTLNLRKGPSEIIGQGFARLSVDQLEGRPIAWSTCPVDESQHANNNANLQFHQPVPQANWTVIGGGFANQFARF